MEALILAGGEGTRMNRITAHLPKALLYLPGGTLLEHHLALLARLTLSHVYVITKHEGWQIKEALRDLHAVTSLTQEPPYTLLGALATAKARIQEACLVVHGDNYFSEPLDYVADAARTVTERSGCEALFVVDGAGKGVGQAERLALTGCYVLSPMVFARAREVRDGNELRCLTQALVDSGVGVEECALRGWRQNINRPGDLLAVTRRILEHWTDGFHPPQADAGYDRAGRSFEIEPPVWVSPQASVVDSHLGPFTVVGPGARVRGCALQETVVFPGAQVVCQDVVRGTVLCASEGCARLAAESDVHRCDEGYSQQEVTQRTPSADQQEHARQQEAGEGDNVD